MTKDLADRLRLIRSENVGPVTFFHLMRRYGRAARALEALPELARRGGKAQAPRIASRAEAEAEIEATLRLGARLLCWDDPDYPSLLGAIEAKPPVIALRGQAKLLHRRAVAVVGARNASANGQRFAQHLAADLGAAELVVVSGMARGIDAAAHKGALATGTVAVLGGGIDQVYPPENQGLYDAMVENGAVIAEMPPGWVAQARDFPRRNRIIAGLSLGVVVVEAAMRSGSLITARHALDQGREVFAVPGSPLDARCRGANDLIRQGAVLTESAADVLSGLGAAAERVGVSGETSTEPFEIPAQSAPAAEAGEGDGARAAVLEALSHTPAEVDEILRRCQLSAPIVQAVLLELELAGRLKRHPGNRVALEAD